MRHLLTGISSLALATLLAGSAVAAGLTSSSRSQQATGNLALQDQLERDRRLSDPWLRDSPLGQVIAPGGATQSSNRLDMGTPINGSGQMDRSSTSGESANISRETN